MLPAPPLRQVAIARRHLDRCVHLVVSAGDRLGLQSVRARSEPWLVAAMGAWSSGDLDALLQLVRVARGSARRADDARRRQRRKEWATWLSGGLPLGPGGRIPITKRAFLYVRGASGWSRSPVDDDSHNGGVPGEADLEEGQPEERWWVKLSARRSGQVAPFCDQAAVEREADQWAELWAERSHYVADPTALECQPHRPSRCWPCGWPPGPLP